MDESYDIASIWAHAVAGSPIVAALCQERFQKSPRCMQGYHFTRKPGEQIAPWVMLLPVADKGGFEVELQHSTVLVAFGVIDDEVIETADGLVEQRGYQSLDQLEQALRAVLSETEFPPSAWEHVDTQPGPNYFERHSMYTVTQLSTTR